MRVVVIGAGMAGILSAVRLGEMGLDDVTVYEKADRLGGTWRENTYPGVACDVPSHLYSYSFAPNPEFSHTFSPGDQIQAYLERTAGDRGVLGRIRAGEEVESAAWHDGRWRITTSTGQRDVADVLIAATGVLHHPRFPEIDGLDSFGGPTFHTARWDHDVEIDGNRVGVVGAGSSAVQVTSAIVDRVARLSLFQRTAQWVLPVENRPYRPEEIAEYRADPAKVTSLRELLSQSFADNFANAVVDAESPQMRAIADACLDNLERNVADPDLRASLTPDYRAGCKRLLVSADFYDAIQRANADLVTTEIDRVEPGGIRTTDGVIHDLDVLVLATGFRVDRFMRPMTITGRGGVDLDDVWSERPTAYLSISIPEFPNLFMLNGPNGPVGNFSLIEVAELQFAYIEQLIGRLRSGDASEICATADATERMEAERVEAAQRTVWVSGCRSWYLDDRGIPAVWPFTFDRFREEMASPDQAAYDIR